MALPLVQGLLAQCQASKRPLIIVTKAKLKDFWTLVPGVSEVISLTATWNSLGADARLIAKYDAEKVFICPHTPRAALTAFLSGITERIGFRSAGVARFLFSTAIDDLTNTTEHQSQTYRRLLEGDSRSQISERLILKVPEKISGDIRVKFSLENNQRFVCFLPGAARGDSKRWPAERFSQLARTFLADFAIDKILILGAPSERGLCEQVAQDARDARVVVLAGETNLLELAAVLGGSQLVVSNDSGGMHLSAALGIPVIAIFGETNPDLTGPTGSNSFVLQRSDIKKRSISRSSASAVEALKRVSVADVLDLVRDKCLLAAGSRTI